MIKFLKRQWPLVGLAVLLAVVAFYLIRSGKEDIRETFLKEIVPGAGLKLKDIQFTQEDPDKKVKWSLDAREMTTAEDKKILSFNHFRLIVEPKDRPFFELTGNRGDYSRESGRINLWGDLEGFSGNGYRITTEHLLYNEKKGLLSSEKQVRITGPVFSIEGRGLFADLEKESFKVLSDVTTVVVGELLIK